MPFERQSNVRMRAVYVLMILLLLSSVAELKNNDDIRKNIIQAESNGGEDVRDRNLVDQQVANQADVDRELRELQAVVKKLGEVAVRHTIALTTTESEVTGLETRLRAGELKAEDQREHLTAVTSDMREVESRVETSERQSQQHQKKITQLGMKMEVAQMQLQASKKQVDRLQEENTGTISAQNKTNNQILAQNKELLQFP